MIDFALSKAATPADAVKLDSAAKTVQQGAEVRYIAGGTTLVDLMKLDVETPRRLVDINRLDRWRETDEAAGRDTADWRAGAELRPGA